MGQQNCGARACEPYHISSSGRVLPRLVGKLFGLPAENIMSLVEICLQFERFVLKTSKNDEVLISDLLRVKVTCGNNFQQVHGLVYKPS